MLKTHKAVHSEYCRLLIFIIPPSSLRKGVGRGKKKTGTIFSALSLALNIKAVAVCKNVHVSVFWLVGRLFLLLLLLFGFCSCFFFLFRCQIWFAGVKWGHAVLLRIFLSRHQQLQSRFFAHPKSLTACSTD
ncbi:hypothetical protein AOLI_G00220580 [Acnodon oligacanthus]